MLTEQEVIQIYAEHGIDATMKDARGDITHMGDFPRSRAHAIELVHGYAGQLRAGREGDMHEAAASECGR